MNRTSELQWCLLYSVVVAGKSADFATAAMKRFFAPAHRRQPFTYIRSLSGRKLTARLKAARTGNYTKLAKCFRALVSAQIDLAACCPEQLERIHGIGPKTSRFFILWTRPGAEHAALDTHVLKWLRYLGHDAPVSTPASSRKYAELERIFLAAARSRGMTARELDSAIWDWCSSGRHAGGLWPAELQRAVENLSAGEPKHAAREIVSSASTASISPGEECPGVSPHEVPASADCAAGAGAQNRIGSYSVVGTGSVPEVVP